MLLLQWRPIRHGASADEDAPTGSGGEKGGGQGPALSNVPRTSIDGPLIADN